MGFRQWIRGTSIIRCSHEAGKEAQVRRKKITGIGSKDVENWMKS